jgi:hypothetical protein
MDAEQRILGSTPLVAEELPKLDSSLQSDELHGASRILKGIKSAWRQRASTGEVQLEGIPWIRVNVTSGLEVLIREDLAAKRGNDVRKWLTDGSALLGVSEGRTEKQSITRQLNEEGS